MSAWGCDDRRRDPRYACDLYREQGCRHVDGELCDYPECPMLADYLAGMLVARTQLSDLST